MARGIEMRRIQMLRRGENLHNNLWRVKSRDSGQAKSEMWPDEWKMGARQRSVQRGRMQMAIGGWR